MKESSQASQACILMAATVGMALLLSATPASSAATLVSRYSFNETSGTTAHDPVGGFNATLQGAAAFDGAGSVVLRGTNGAAYISLPGTQLSGLAAVTIDAWFTYTVPNNNVHLFSIDNGSGTGSGGTYLRYNVCDSGNGHGSTNFLENIVSWGGNVLHGGMVLPKAVTNHVTVVYDPVNGVKEIFVSGTLMASYSGSIAALSSFPLTAFNLGRSPWWAYGDPYLNGSINEFRVYAGVLSGEEVAANEASGPDSIPQVLVGLPYVSPTNNVFAGETARLSCGVSGPVTGHRWEWDSGSGGASFTVIPDSSSLTYTQNTTGLLGDYQYRLVATNSSSSATSAVVTLTINAATIPMLVADTTPSTLTRYTGGTATFSASFDGNHPIALQWQADTGAGYTNIPGATSNTLQLTGLVLASAGSYRLTATNALGGNASAPAILAVKDASLAKFQWLDPVAFNGLNADQILTNVAGNLLGGAVFGTSPQSVTLGNGRIVSFTTDGSIASATGNGTATGAYPAGTAATTGSASLDAVLNEFNWDGGPKTIYLNNLQPGEQYSVQLFGVDDRDTGVGESNRLACFQCPSDPDNVSATFRMGDNVYVVGTFYASDSVESIQMNLPMGNNGNINALVLRALSFLPTNQPPTITTSPESQTVFAGRPASFTVTAISYVIPAYQWQAGPAGGPYTNLSNSTWLGGATNSLLTISDASFYNGAEFQVVLSNPAGSALSGTATLNALPLPASSALASSAVLALAPIAYWPLNETNDPAGGTSPAYDAAGTYDGAYLAAAQNAFNGVAGVQAADGFALFATNPGALKSTASTDQSWVTTPALNLNTNTVTISMWIYPDGDQPAAAGLFVNRNSGTAAGLGYYNSDRLGYKWNNDAQATWAFDSGLLIPTNLWSFVAVVVEPEKATLYLYNANGMRTATNFTSHASQSWDGNSANIRIGCDNLVSRTFNGKIDEVTVFNRALRFEQIEQLAGLTRIHLERSEGKLLLSWPYGTLLEAAALEGPWKTNSNPSPCLVVPQGPSQFYRVQVP